MPPSKTPLKLKTPRPWLGTSSTLHTTTCPATQPPRDYYLAHPHLVYGPILSCSEFLPRPLIPHLMHGKKDGALGVKYISGDEITNMEGCLHTFLTPLVRTLMFGDYVFRTRHGVQKFKSVGRMQVAREVILSAAIQMDFEMRSVMCALARVGEEEIVGREVAGDFAVLGQRQKGDGKQRGWYENVLRKHMIFHLLEDGRLPALSQISKNAMDMRGAMKFLEQFVLDPKAGAREMVGRFVKIGSGGDVLSLELLFNTAVHQFRNEFSALEMIATRGYIYTHDPASIFAREIGADLLNRIMFAALKQLSSENVLLNMRAYGFNDYADKGGMHLVEVALARQKHVKVLSKSKLFRGPDDTYDPSHIEGGTEAWLVIHNNSDAFGQNIETEGEYGSLDGAVGVNSSAAASLERGREDLLRWII